MAKYKKLFYVFSKFVLLTCFLILIYSTTIYFLKSISLEISKNILDYVQALIWPVVVLIALFEFKSNVSALIDRIEEGEIPGVTKFKTSHTEASQQINEGNSVGEVRSGQIDLVVGEKESKIENLKDTQDKLLERLARSEVELDFERIYNFIFASQIALLNKLRFS